ncbi:Ig-like domain-containing protein [Paenibacillus thiaminolyticus]|nr:Ig-like domain-containing protein [Paenibacillus thiaminolyticus]
MREMSYQSSKQDSQQTKQFRGGDKKVMKKRLALLLSVAMAFSMFANVAFGADAAKTTQEKFDALKEAGIFSGYPGTDDAKLEQNLTRAEFAKVVVKALGLKEVEGVYTYKDKNYGPNHWAAKYIEAVTAEGLMQGTNTTKKLFGTNDNITVQEASKVLVLGYDFDIPENAQNNASDWAKNYFQAAVDAGLFSKDANPKANATRGQLVEAVYAADEAAKGPKVESAKVIDSKNVEVTMSDKEVVKVELKEALKANVETEISFEYKGKEYTTKVTYVVTDATKVESVTADNLREVHVKFDGEVDPMTGGDESNYSLNNDGKIKSVKLSDDKREAILTVYLGSDENEGLKNQKEYKLTVSNVRAGNAVITAKDVKFTPVDAALPTVEKVEALGTKAVKITFSEPIKKATNSNLKIDGQIVGGSTDITANTVIFKLYNTISVGEHTLSVENVEDFAGFKNILTEQKFTVVEDTVAPTIESVEKATFEKVTLKFSKPVDKSTVIAGNVYWTQGSTKKYANKVNVIADDTYEFEFSESNRLLYTTDLYVTGVKDYSNNAIASDAKIQVNPVIDQTRPEVINAELKDDLKTIEVKFSKSLELESAQKNGNYVIKDKDGKEVAKLKESIKLDDKKVTITLFQKLEEDKDYTLEINGVTDNTTLKNVMMPYSAKLEVGNKSRPSLKEVQMIKDENKIIVTFSKEMATSGEGSIIEKKNYMYELASGGKKELPDDTAFSVSSDRKSVIISMPRDDVKVEEIQQFYVQLVRDTAGNVLSNLIDSDKPSEANAIEVTGVKATSSTEIEVEFNQTLQSGSASVSEFEVKTVGGSSLSVSNAVVDGSKVKLTLSDSDKLNANATFGSSERKVTVTVKAKSSLVTPSGKRVEVTQSDKEVKDGIKPEVKELANKTVTEDTYSVDVVFNETLLSNLDKDQIVYDFEVKAGGDVLTQVRDFQVTEVDGNRITIKLTQEVYDKYKGKDKLLEVRVRPNAVFIKDVEGNVAEGSDDFFPAYIK